jgi:hypothetical protein
MNAPRDSNRIPVIIGTSSADGTTPTTIYVDPSTHRVLVDLSSGSGTVTSVSVVTANGVSGTVATATTTPAITLTLGAITPSAVQISGLTASQIVGTDASKNLVSLAVATYPSLTELTYVKGVTSSIQTQIDAKGAGTVTSVSVATANGFSGTVANATTTPAITIIAGQIVPTTVNGLTITANGTNTLNIAVGKTLVISNSLTLIGTDSTTMTFPSTSAVIARTDAGNTFTGVSTGSAWVLTSPTITTKLNPTSDDGAPLGDTTHNWSDLFLASGAVVNYANSNVVLTHTSGVLTLGTGNLIISTAGTASGSVVTIDGTQTLTNKTITSPKMVTSVLDTNGNILLNIGATGSAVNYVKITNAATGTAGPILEADGETNVDLKLAGKGTGAVHVTTGQYGDLTADSDGATITFNLATSNIHTVTLGGNRTLALSNTHVGQCFMLRLLQDGTGSRTVTFFTTIKWAGGTAPTLTTTASKADMFGFVVTSAGNYDGFVVGANL